MKHYENITNQTIQLFPQLFLGKHGLLHALQRFVKPSDNVEAACSSRGSFRPGVRHMVNKRECAQVSQMGKDPDESVDRSPPAAQPVDSVGEVTADPPSSGSLMTGGIEHEPKRLVKRQSETSKVTSRRSSRAVSQAGRPTGNGRPMAAGVRDEEEANASGNAEDRAVPPPPCQGAGTHPSRYNACRRLQVILHKKTIAEP
jgi:hypothetical protein